MGPLSLSERMAHEDPHQGLSFEPNPLKAWNKLLKTSHSLHHMASTEPLSTDDSESRTLSCVDVP